MLWLVIFAISIAQGLFLISLIAFRESKNPLASRFIIAMLGIMVLTCLGYFVIRTKLVNYVPQLFGLPFGMVFLFGPLLYFYSRALCEPAFEWKKAYWVHFIPYGLQLIYNLPFLLAGNTFCVYFVNLFLSGNAYIRTTEKFTFILQDLHLFIYLLVTMRLLIKTRNDERRQYTISISGRIKWLRSLVICFTVFLATVFGLYVFLMIGGKYIPVTNYVYTLVTSGIIYFIAYKLVLSPDLISPDFAVKYKSYMRFEGEKGEKHLDKLKALMTESKIYLDPEFKIMNLAKELDLPAHQLSKLINEKFGKSFSDLVNEYRVKEFIERINQPAYNSFSIYGVALEVGFNSKSSFNSAFKKVTGKTPSEFKG